MKKTIFFVILAVLFANLMFTGYQCGSAEMTSSKLYMQRSEWENAKDQLQKELAKRPENYEAWYWLGRVNHEQKNYPEMLSAFNNSLKLSGQFTKEIDAIRLSVWAQTFNKGVEHFNSALSSEPDKAPEFFDKAISQLKTAITVQPDSFPPYRVLALTFYGMKDKNNAENYLKEALARQNDGHLGRILGGIYYDRAMSLKAEALKLESPQKEEAFAKVKIIFNQAIQALEHALVASPNDAAILIILNDSYIAAGRTEDAMKSYQLAIVADPNNKLVHYNYGVLLLRAANFAEAAEQFEIALNIDQDFTDALYNVSATYMQWGARMKEKAEAEIKNDKNKQLDKSFEEKFRKAKGFLERLVKLSENDVAAWETLGMANTLLNIPKEAKVAFDKADSLRKAK
ncbi:MAG: tetratricopeptide repeat protein [Bacteroidota bacterium]|nr:tetratricopeptide repeat protein [Bacteroidota bacterium]